jgi:hypothetical protein
MNSVRVLVFDVRCSLNISSWAGNFCSRVKRLLRARLRFIKPLWVYRDVKKLIVWRLRLIVWRLGLLIWTLSLKVSLHFKE